jgi:hypothetical protein
MMSEKQPAIVRNIKWVVAIVATAGISQMVYLATESYEFTSFAGLALLIGYAVYDS